MHSALLVLYFFIFTLGVPGAGIYFIINCTVAPLIPAIKPNLYLFIWAHSAARLSISFNTTVRYCAIHIKTNTDASGFCSKQVLKLMLWAARIVRDSKFEKVWRDCRADGEDLIIQKVLFLWSEPGVGLSAREEKQGSTEERKDKEFESHALHAY